MLCVAPLTLHEYSIPHAIAHTQNLEEKDSGSWRDLVMARLYLVGSALQSEPPVLGKPKLRTKVEQKWRAKVENSKAELSWGTKLDY